MTATKICSVEDCDEPARTRGWCSRHYNRWRTHGNPCAPFSKGFTWPGTTDLPDRTPTESYLIGKVEHWRTRVDIWRSRAEVAESEVARLRERIAREGPEGE